MGLASTIGDHTVAHRIVSGFGGRVSGRKGVLVGIRLQPHQRALLAQVQAALGYDREEPVSYGEALEVACEAYKRERDKSSGSLASPPRIPFERRPYADRLTAILADPKTDERLFSALEVALTALESSTRQ